MRSIWAGAISFGLVVIPVKLYAATEQRDITFRQVHLADGARIQFRRVCTLDGEEVPYADIAKGYELPTGDMGVPTGGGPRRPPAGPPPRDGGPPLRPGPRGGPDPRGKELLPQPRPRR